MLVEPCVCDQASEICKLHESNIIFKVKDHQKPDNKIKKEVKEFDMFKPKQELIRCKLCKDKKFVNEKSLKYHQIFTHFFPNLLSDTGGVMKCPKCKVKFNAKNELAKHFIERHFDDFLKNEYSEEKKPRKPESVSLDTSLEEELPHSTKDLDQKPLPKCREMQTVHGKKNKENKTDQKSSSPSSSSSSTPSARQRMNDR